MPKYIPIIISFIIFLIPKESRCEKITVTAYGLWDMSNITPERAKVLALENAKENALREAGISEEFIVVNTGSVSDKVTRFVSYSNSELSGEIISFTVLEEGIKSKEGRHFYETKIRATVRKGVVKRDLEFDVLLEGIKTFPYRDGEQFSFSVTPFKDCYLHLFWLDESGTGSLVFPNTAEHAELLKKNETYRFPRTQSYKTRKETDEITEIISLIFVFTKQNIPFTDTATFENIQQWIVSIPSDKRVMKYETAVITK